MSSNTKANFIKFKTLLEKRNIPLESLLRPALHEAAKKFIQSKPDSYGGELWKSDAESRPELKRRQLLKDVKSLTGEGKTDYNIDGKSGNYVTKYFDNWRKNENDLDLAIAVYYFFHLRVDDIMYAHIIDYALFGGTRTLEEKIGSPVPGKYYEDSEKRFPIRFRPTEASKNNLFHESNVTFQRRDELIEQLNKFITCDDSIKVWAISGPSGAGKTRLSHEFMLHSPTMPEDEWEQIILGDHDLNNDHDPKYWKQWTPEFNTLLVIDYLYVYNAAFTALLNRCDALQNRKELQHHIRILLIDHVFPENLNQLRIDGRFGLDRFDTAKCDTFFFNKGSPLDLNQSLDRDIIIPLILSDASGLPTKNETVKQACQYLKHGKQKGCVTADDTENQAVNHSTWQPLFAILLGDAIRSAPKNTEVLDVTQWNRQQLIQGFLNKQNRILWKLKEQKVAGAYAAAFIAAATARSGVSFDALTECKARHPQAEKFSDYNEVERLCKTTLSVPHIIDTIPPFEPDILGETFFLMFLQAAQKDRDLLKAMYQVFHQMLSTGNERTQINDASEFIAFIKRLTRNLCNDNQENEEVRKHWEALLNFLKPCNFPEANKMRWSVSVAIMHFLQTAGVPYNEADVIHDVSENVFYDNISHPFISESAECALLYFDLKLSSSEEQATEVPFEIQKLLNRSKVLDDEPLLLAARVNCVNVVELLIKLGEDINQTGKNGATALMYASLEGHVRVVELLLKYDELNVNQINAGKGTALMQAAVQGHIPAVKLLLSHNAIRVNMADENGVTALIFAVIKNHKNLVKELISDSRIDVNQADNNGVTALIFAAMDGHEDIVDILLADKRVDVNKADKNGGTALMFAAQYGNEHITQSLLKHNNINVNQCHSGGGTALMCAVMTNCKHTVELLLSSKDLRINQECKQGKTALTYAKSGGNEEIERLLRNA
ncbi:MAG: ankyrin repeat domain-containing protein [Pseudomonadota bacterium]